MRDARGCIRHSGLRRRCNPGGGDARFAGRPRGARGGSDRAAQRRGAPHRDGACGARACNGEIRVGRHCASARRDVPRGCCVSLRDGRWRFLLVLPLMAAAIALIIWHGPNWGNVRDAFTLVRWEWVFAAIGLNLVSVLARAYAWDTVIKQSIAPPRPAFPLVFSAFSVGLFANAVLPGRVGELARVAVLRRRIPGRRGTTATLVGSVFAHRMFDLFPAVTLVIWVLLTAKIPGWALTSIAIVLAVGVVLFITALLLARRANRDALEGLGPLRALLVRARLGLAVMRSPTAAATAA